MIWLLLSLYAAGQVLVLVGERTFGAGDSWRLPATVVGVALTALVLAFRTWQLTKKSDRPPQQITARLLASYGLGAAGLGLYFLTAFDVFGDGDVGVAARVAWPILWLVGHSIALFSEISLASMAGGATYELRRVVASGRSGAVIALAAGWLFLLNYLGTAKDEELDMRSVKDVATSATTLEMARNLNAPVGVTLFFPAASEVADSIRRYFDSLAGASKLVTVEWVDQQMNPARAEELKARKNGTIVIHRGDRQQRLVVELEEDKSRDALRSLDVDFQDKLARVVRGKRTAYFVTGHGERIVSPDKDDPPGLAKVKERLLDLNYDVKTLGVSEGLGQRISSDADLVFVVGPKTNFLLSEEQTLLEYVQQGGSLMLLVDPDVDPRFEMKTLLGGLGLENSGVPLAHSTAFVRFYNKKIDSLFLHTNKFANHDSVAVLHEYRTRVALLFPKTGSLTKARGDKAGSQKVTFTVKARSGTWADANGNLEYDQPGEHQGEFNLIAAVELPVPEGGTTPGRAIVTADADLITDLVLLQWAANLQFLEESLRWLEREPPLTEIMATLDDAPIIHTKAEDQGWFYGAIIGIPLLLLGVGIGLRIRRSSARARRASA